MIIGSYLFILRLIHISAGKNMLTPKLFILNFTPWALNIKPQPKLQTQTSNLNHKYQIVNPTPYVFVM